MADDTTQPQQASGPTEDKPVWAKNPKTGEVLPLWKPEDLHAARANQFVDATQQEADKAHQEIQLEGWKGTVAAGAAGVAETVPFARNIARAVAPEFGSDVDRSVEAHPVVHGVATLATIAAGGGVTRGLEAAGAAAEGVVSRALLTKTAEAAAEKGVKSAVPTLAARVLGRVPDAAKNATVGLGFGGLELTNEKDLPHSPEELASHVMGSLFWGTAGGVVGGELAHGLMKAASPLVQATSKALGRSSDALENMAAALKVGDGAGVIGKSRSALQGGVDAIDSLGKQKAIDEGMEAVRLKVGDAGMGPLDAARIQAETAYTDARANLLRKLGMDVTENSKKVRKISADKLGRALKAEDNADVVEALQDFHKAGKGLQDFHEQLAQAGATGSEGLSAKVSKQVDGLIEVQDAMKAGIAGEEGHKAGDILKDVFAGGVAAHFGHALLGKAYVAAKVAGKLWEMAPAEFKAARLAQLARVSEGVSGHLERVASAAATGGTGKFAAPAASLLSLDEFHKLRDDTNAKVSNPQLALDHFHEKAGVVNDFAPDTYAQMGAQYGIQLQLMAAALAGPTMQGPYSPKYQPSATELQKASTAISIIKDPRVAEAKFAKGTLTPAEAKIYNQAHGPRAAALQAQVVKGMKEGMKADKNTLKAMTGMMVMGIGTPRASYSQPMLQRTQGMYSQRMNQQGGPGSRGGTGGAKALTASQMISLPGQRVSNRTVR